MEQQQSREEDQEEIKMMNIKEFMEIARQYFFGSDQQPAMALAPVRTER